MRNTATMSLLTTAACRLPHRPGMAGWRILNMFEPTMAPISA